MASLCRHGAFPALVAVTAGTLLAISPAEATIWLRRDNRDCSHGHYNLPVHGSDPALGVFSLMECKAKCESEPLCEGIMVPVKEDGYEDSKGMCWLRRTIHLPGCHKSDTYHVWERISGQRTPPEGTWESFGHNTACRRGYRDSSEDGEGSALVYGAPDLDSCKGLCGTSEFCYGVEYEAIVQRCEVWVQPINAVAAVANFECLAFKPKGFDDIMQ